MGIIRTDAYFGEIRFSILSSQKYQLAYSYGSEIKLIELIEEDHVRLKFNVPIELWKDQLIIFLDGEPAIDYKVK